MSHFICHNPVYLVHHFGYMSSCGCYEKNLIIVHCNLRHFIFLRWPHPIRINEAINLVFLSLLAHKLAEKSSIFVTDWELYSSRSLSPENLFLMHEFVDVSLCLINTIHINSMVGLNQLLQLLLFGIQTIPGNVECSPAPLHKVHTEILNLFEETKHLAPNWVGLGPQSSYLIFTLPVGHPLFLKLFDPPLLVP